MRDLTRLLASLGHVAQSSTLARHGVTRTELEANLRSGAVHRLRRGWFATASADADQVRAVTLGGRIGCVSALARWGAWAGEDDRLHVHLAPNASRLRWEAGLTSYSNAPFVWSPSIDRRLTTALVGRLCSSGAPTLHWGERGLPEDGAFDWLVPPRLALAQAVLCQEDEHAIACADSVIRHGILSESIVKRLLESLPKHAAVLAEELTPTADSGWESIFITRLRRAGFAVQSQFEVPGVGLFDGLIEGCVAFEINGLAFHSGPDQVQRDTGRVLGAQALGLPTLVLNPQHIRDDWATVWPAVERVIRDAIRSRDARWLRTIQAIPTTRRG